MYIKTKISLIFVVMSLMMITIGAAYFYTSIYIQGKYRSISASSLPSMDTLNEIRGSVWGLWEFRDEDTMLKNAFIELEENILEYRKISNIPSKDEKSIRLRSSFLDLQEEFDDVTYTLYLNRVKRINEVISEAMAAESNQLNQQSSRMEFLTASISSLSMLLIAVGLFGCLIPGWWLASNISNSLLKAQKAADQIASGDLSHRLSEDGHDEITQLAGAFNRMVDTIRQADEEITREVEDRVAAERKAQIAAKAKSDFLAHMSHEFRTPLNGILGYSQMLSRDGGLSEKNLEVVKSLRKSGQNLLELINNVLDLSKIEAQKMNVHKSRFYLGDFLDSLLISFSEQVKGKGLEYKVDIHPDLPEDILSDQMRLRQILINLIGNAIKFTEEGHVGISVSPVENGVRFSVFDSGIGISPEHHDDVMQPFKQVEDSFRKIQGTGLGLAISNRLLEMMGTHLNLDSELGKGTTFYFDLPQPEVKFRKLVHSPTRVTGYRGKTKKILIGEEGDGTASTLIPLLQKVGFEVLHVKSPESFTEKCFFFQADVVCMDLYFGKVGGVTIMNQINERYAEDSESSLPVILLFSDHRNPNERERALQSGANGFLGIPIRFVDLLIALRDELDLVWIEETGSVVSEGASTPIEPKEVVEVTPDLTELQRLLELARSGNVRQLKQGLTELKEQDQLLQVFVDRLLVLCGDYKVNAILQELEKRMYEKLVNKNQDT